MLRQRRPVKPSATAEGSERPSAAAGVEGKDDQRVRSDIPTLLRRFWKVAAPYWSSEDKVQARLRLAAVFLLTLGTTGISVGFNFLLRDFYNALSNKDQEQFTKQLLYYLGGFAGGIPFFVLRDYAKDTLSLRWRSWMTSYYMKRYFKNQSFYRIQSQSVIDNPDQRIVDDLNSFTGAALSLSLRLLNSAVDLISFSNILFRIYPPLFVALIVYSLGGTALSMFLGKGLVTLNFKQEKKEADFRYGLVRIRENAESIAFYGGERNEMQLLLERFRNAFENLMELLIASRNLDFFTISYRHLIQILPAAVVAPMYFSGKIEFGVINQSVSAFKHILEDFSLIVYQFQTISAFSAVIDRLGEFDDILDDDQFTVSKDDAEKITIMLKDRGVSSFSNGLLPQAEYIKLLEVQDLTLQTPRSNNILIRDLSLEIKEKDHLLVMGPSGSGKTSFLRALSGLWNSGDGTISFYVKDAKSQELFISEGSGSVDALKEEESSRYKSKRPKEVFFLPQRPYMVLGTLRQQLLYPTWSDVLPTSKSIQSPVLDSEVDVDKPEVPSNDDLIRVLEIVRLGNMLSRFNGLDSVYEWSSVLSLGEQQRIAFARLLLSKPRLVLLDESTSALDDVNEAHLYKQIEAAGITYISIGHRKTLYNYHKRVLHILNCDSNDSNRRNWHLEAIDRTLRPQNGEPSYMTS